MASVELLGWLATAVFVLSYFCPGRRAQIVVQMAGAAMWVGYGAVIGASPVVAANLAVLAAAGWALVRRRPAAP